MSGGGKGAEFWRMKKGSRYFKNRGWWSGEEGGREDAEGDGEMESWRRGGVEEG